MILSDIRKYLSKNKTVTLKDLFVHFNIEPDAMQGMLQEWKKHFSLLAYT